MNPTPTSGRRDGPTQKVEIRSVRGPALCIGGQRHDEHAEVAERWVLHVVGSFLVPATPTITPTYTLNVQPKKKNRDGVFVCPRGCIP